MTYQSRIHTVEAWQMPAINTDTTSKLVPTPIWALHYMACNPAVSPSRWLVKSDSNIEAWTDTAFAAAYEPAQLIPRPKPFNWATALTHLANGRSVRDIGFGHHTIDGHLILDSDGVVLLVKNGRARRFEPADATTPRWTLA